MLEKISKRTGIHYNAEGIRKKAIRIGIGMIVVLLLLCYLEIKKESIAAGWYEKTLYKATAQGRWLKYGQYEPDTLYQKIIDKIPILHYARMRVLQTGKQAEPAQVEEEDKENVTEVQKQSQGNLPVRYAFGNIQNPQISVCGP